MSAPEAVLKVPEVAEILGVHRKTVIRYLATGKIRARKTPGGRGIWLVKPEALDEFLNDDYDPRSAA